MVFSSPRFLLFLVVTLVTLAILSGREAKKRFLALASCFFYASWDWRYLGLLLTISVIDYYAALRIVATNDGRSKKRWVWFSIISNLGVLAYFKYFNFFVDNANTVLSVAGLKLPYLTILLPAGISFYTFKTMSYTIDVYRGELTPCRSWLDYATFITFFPELIAGPIVRASVFLPQLNRPIGLSISRLLEGGGSFLVGLFKKMVIADRMALVVDPIFKYPEVYSGATIWCALLAYAIQIYCDFSGYSDMAIGVARMIGYDLPENFNMPYAAVNLSDFWRRWHITLSSWLRDYLYIPLGGSRCGSLLTYRNLALTMLLGGLWHGASWNFVLWGGMHGVGLAVHRLWQRNSSPRFNLPVWLGWLITLFFVTLTWVPFRALNFHDTLVCYSKLFGLFPDVGVLFLPFWLPVCLSIILTCHLFGHLCRRDETIPLWFGQSLTRLGLRVHRNSLSGSYLVLDRLTMGSGYLITMIVLLVFLFGATNTNPFIYFQF